MPCQAPLLALVLLCLLFLLLPLGSVRASGTESSPRLPAPKNVMVYSYNFHSLLRWSPVEVDRSMVLYTVHFKTGFLNQWDEMNCTHITETECSFPWSLRRRRWTVFLRVRAELGQATSDWVETDPFVAERNTTIGPPKVNSVTESSDSLLINVTPPFGSEAGYFPEYHVSYWENTTSTTKREIKRSNSLFKIENLKELTLYCFRIQVVLKVYPDLQLLGLPSVPECYRTTVSEATKTGYLILILALVLPFVTLATVGLFLLWRHHKAIKYWFQPPLEIPSHFEEYLNDPSMPALEGLDNHAEDDPHDSLSVVSDPHDSLSVVSDGEGSQACGGSLDGQARTRSISRDSEVT